MKVLVFAFALCLACLALGEGDVVVLTEENFTNITKNTVTMVKFYAPWCGHCKSFAPEYVRAAKWAKQDNKPYILAEMDATVATKTPSKYGVSSYPTLKLLMNGVAVTYTGKREADALLSFIDEKMKFHVTKLTTPEGVKEVMESKGLRVC